MTKQDKRIARSLLFTAGAISLIALLDPDLEIVSEIVNTIKNAKNQSSKKTTQTKTTQTKTPLLLEQNNPRY